MAKFKAVLIDISGLAGVALVSYGAWLVTPAAGFTTGGLFLIALAIFNSRAAAKT